jgi:hypothetical protein
MVDRLHMGLAHPAFDHVESGLNRMICHVHENNPPMALDLRLTEHP